MNKTSSLLTKLLYLTASGAMGYAGYQGYKKSREMQDPAYRLGNRAMELARAEKEKLKKTPWPKAQTPVSEFTGSMGKIV